VKVMTAEHGTQGASRTSGWIGGWRNCRRQPRSFTTHGWQPHEHPICWSYNM